MSDTAQSSESMFSSHWLPPMAHVPIEDILAHPHNWHVHSEEQLAAVRASFDEFGTDMDAADYNVRTKHLLDGHARMEILRERGVETLYCQLHDLSEEDERRWLLTKDKTASMAGIDDANLKLLLSEFDDTENFPPGWDQIDFNALVAAGEAESKELEKLGVFQDPDEVPSRVLPGEVWRVGPHFFGCLDSENPDNVFRMLRLANIRRVDQIFTDPPYQMEASGGEYTLDTGQAIYNRTKLETVISTGLDCCDPEAEFLPTLPAWFGWKGQQPNKHEQLNVFLYCNNAMQLPYMRWASQVGALWDTLMWDKNRGDPLGGRHDRSTEYLIWLKYRARWNDKALAPHADRSRYLKYAIAPEQEASGFPCPKSVDLAMNEMLLTTTEEDWIADPYGGTGAHVIAAATLGRSAIYMDQSRQWTDFAMRWMETITGQPAERVSSCLTLEKTDGDDRSADRGPNEPRAA